MKNQEQRPFPRGKRRRPSFSSNRKKEKKQETKVSNVLTDSENTVLKVLSSQATDVDSIITATGLKTPDVLNILLTLELRGIIKQLPGKKYIVTE